MIFKNFKQPKILLAGIPVALLLIASVFLFYLDRFAHTPFPGPQEPTIFLIEPGQSLNLIAANLEKQGLIAGQLRFKLYARYQKEAAKLKAGEYEISSSQTPALILDQLVKGRVKLLGLTIPEGLNIMEIARLVEKTGFCSLDDFLFLCQDPEFISFLKVESLSLEGYLYPDTYFFPRHTPCRQIIRKMVKTFHQVYDRKWQDQTQALGFSVHEIVTLASLIEKETGAPEERPLISSVFHNRLQRKMRLESDPTAIYGDWEFQGKIRKKHLQRKTPYNTYQIPGLPLGPIANPGALALEAALFPATSPYLFFVSKNDTTHAFSETLGKHNKAVQKYQRSH